MNQMPLPLLDPPNSTHYHIHSAVGSREINDASPHTHTPCILNCYISAMHSFDVEEVWALLCMIERTIKDVQAISLKLKTSREPGNRNFCSCSWHGSGDYWWTEWGSDQRGERKCSWSDRNVRITHIRRIPCIILQSETCSFYPEDIPVVAEQAGDSSTTIVAPVEYANACTTTDDLSYVSLVPIFISETHICPRFPLSSILA